MKRHMRISFTDGSTLEFLFPPVVDPSVVGNYMNELMTKTNIMVEADGHLYFIPTQNIKYIDVTPTPDTVGSMVVKGAKLVG